MALLAVLAGDRPLKLRLTELLEPQHSLASVHSWGGLLRIVRERPATGAIVNLEAIPVYPSSERILAGLRTQFPHLGLVILIQKRRDPFTLFLLGKAGIRHLVLLQVDESKHELAKTLARAGEEGDTSFVVRALSPYLPRRELRIAHLAMDSVHRRWSAEELADEVGLTRPYLSERFRKVGFPSLGHFLLWTKLFHAGHWLEEPGRTGESVGRQLEYSSGAAFRRALKLYTGATPTEVREGGGVHLIWQHFLRRNGLRAPRSWRKRRRFGSYAKRHSGPDSGYWWPDSSRRVR
ncbi:MAG: AraC family transcriptional regulator [Gemmatimonadales bacterium]|nr:MAG: AraC family transcriptional regulator [Gemmatimonadales bacterium]